MASQCAALPHRQVFVQLRVGYFRCPCNLAQFGGRGLHRLLHNITREGLDFLHIEGNPLLCRLSIAAAGIGVVHRYAVFRNLCFFPHLHRAEVVKGVVCLFGGTHDVGQPRNETVEIAAGERLEKGVDA